MGRFIFVTLGLLVVAFSIHGVKGCSCPRDWLPMNGFCYKVFEEIKNWNDAEMACRKHKPGCHLASIHSIDQGVDLAEYITDYLTRKTHVWIGLRDPRKQRTWEWSDRSSINYLSWNPGEPNNDFNKEHCVHLWSPAGYKKWNDTPCESLHPFLCQCKF
ncbi:C-type lectin mannose-binding isoform-like [Pantherophis guttatus]|uniref:C-type lectin mannose-binding isoform-like n=1 Tax=Pantherophis guttatus TaxID=94885 RepID=A0ABM3ZA50_PANGU|nr:C-type lectin mannose-binding isoform-like [Pantherophis guttatus]